MEEALKTKKRLMIFIYIFLIFFSIKLPVYLLFVSMLVFFCYSLIKYRLPLRPILKNPLFLPLLLLFSWSIFSVLWVPDLREWLETMEKDFYFLLFFLMLLYAIEVVKKDWLNYFLGGLLITIGYAVYEYFFLASRRAYRLSSLYGNVNFFAGVLVLILPICLALLLDRKAYFYQRILGLVLFLVGTLTLIGSQSRAAWVALAVALLVLALVKNFKLVAPLLLIAILGMVLAQPHIPQQYINRAKTILSLDAYLSRIAIWQVSGEIMKENPIIGSGRGSFRPMYDEISDTLEPITQRIRRFPNVNHAHNIFLQIGTELGFVGLLLLSLFLFRVFQYSFRLLKEKEVSFYLQGGLAAGFAGLLVHLQMHFSVGNRNLTMLALFLLAILYQEATTGRREPHPTTS